MLTKSDMSFTGAPAFLVFPSEQFGTVSSSQDVMLVNTGTPTLDITSIGVIS